MLIMWNSLGIFDFGGGEISLDLISPGIMIPNHSRWHTIFFLFFFSLPKTIQVHTRHGRRFCLSLARRKKKASIWKQSRLVPTHGIAGIISVEPKTRNHTMASLLKIYQAGTLFGAALPNITQCCLLNAVFGLSVPWF